VATFHLRGTVLPEGDLRDLWILGDQLTFQRPAGAAETIHEGGFLLPGLVDAHAHAGHDADTMALDPAALEAACREYARNGTTLLRMPGHRAPIPDGLRGDPALPRLITAGSWLAWSGLDELGQLHTPVGEADLPAVAVAQARANDGWAKTYADWEPLKPVVPRAVLAAVCDAVHTAGGRVAVHSQNAEGIRNAVLAGADSIEHAWYLTPDLIAVLAARGGAITPTWTGFAGYVEQVRTKPEGPRKDWFMGGIASMAPGVRGAYEAGVHLLAGSDSLGFGDVVTEVEWLIGLGVPATAAIGAASWDARAYLGLPGLEEGAPADIVAYDTDPRVEPDALRHPARVILRGHLN
jgi:imidazolonepropionase-like amidohydrolase